MMLGYQASFFLGFYFSFSIRLTDPISGNALDAKRKKKGGWPKDLKEEYEKSHFSIEQATEGR